MIIHNNGLLEKQLQYNTADSITRLSGFTFFDVQQDNTETTSRQEHELLSFLKFIVTFCHSREGGNPLLSFWIPAQGRNDRIKYNRNCTI